MLVRLIAAGKRLPAWIDAGYAEYAARLRSELRLELVEIPLAQRSRHPDLTRALATEGARMLAAIGTGHYVTALQVDGQAMDTGKVAKWLAARMRDGRDLSLLIGGPDGLDPGCLQRADSRWSLSPLTFPHGLVRVMVAEQLYRAFSLLKGHPYHRA